MKINKTIVIQSIERLSKSTTNKFWGSLAIIMAIDEEIKPNKTYRVNSSSVMKFLDKLFNLDNPVDQNYNESIIYVKFSALWKERLKALTLRAIPDLNDVAIFYSKFDEFHDTSISITRLKDNFLNDCKIRLNDLNTLFVDSENRNIELENYTIVELIEALELALNLERKDNYHLSLEPPYFIQSRPSELKRAPFIQTLYSGDRIKELVLLSDSNLEELYPERYFVPNVVLNADSVLDFVEAIDKTGLHFNRKLIVRYTASLLSKPFVILTGLSGSGKTKLAQSFAQWICRQREQYKLVPVGSDWTNREPLLGYPNALNNTEYVKPDSGVLDLIIRANRFPDQPHFLILDEMNLSHVERYFADFLSVMESRHPINLHGNENLEQETGIPQQLMIPSNLFVVGTVNIDETTHMFSPKVLDRANTIEFRIDRSEMVEFLNSPRVIDTESLNGRGATIADSFVRVATNREISGQGEDVVHDSLVKFFEELQKIGAEFGYRSATEMLRLIDRLTLLDSQLTIEAKADIAVLQKLLPKLHGSRRKLCPVLEKLASFCVLPGVDVKKEVLENAEVSFTNDYVLYPLSLEKITRMYRNAISHGFASFAEA